MMLRIQTDYLSISAIVFKKEIAIFQLPVNIIKKYNAGDLKLPVDSIQIFKEFASDLADASEEVIMSYYQKDIAIEDKTDSSPVTIADRSAEEKMRDMITEKFPDHGIIGEEYGDKNTDAEYTWVLDPIDGTKSFIHGTPLFGTLIALLRNKKPFMGMINFPALKERIIGVEGSPTIYNNRAVRTSGNKDISKSLVLCTDHLDLINNRDEKAFLKMVGQAKLYRGWGDCYMYMLLARGDADVVIDPLMSYWDIQALIPIIKGAGGAITGYKGEAPENADGMIASASADLHDFVIKSLNP